MEVVGPLAGVGSLLSPCRSQDQTLVVSLGSYSAIFAEGPLTFVPLGPGRALLPSLSSQALQQQATFEHPSLDPLPATGGGDEGSL